MLFNVHFHVIQPLGCEMNFPNKPNMNMNMNMNMNIFSYVFAVYCICGRNKLCYVIMLCLMPFYSFSGNLL